MKYDCVLEGGGVKIPGLVGALQGIEQEGFSPNRFAGTSAGAIVAAMRAAGYSPYEMEKMIYDIDFKQFRDGAHRGTKIFHLLFHKGVYAGDAFLKLMREFMGAKEVTTFADLKYPLRVYAADVSNGRLVCIPDDMEEYGLHPHSIEVAWAVRCSMSIPFFFRPVKINTPIGNGGDIYFVDGGLLSNFPINTWDTNETPKCPTFGVALWEDNAGKKQTVKGPINFLSAVFDTMLGAHDRKLIQEGDYDNRTIRVPVGCTATTDFDISLERKRALVENGLISTKDFFRTWNWENYKEWARIVRGLR